MSHTSNADKISEILEKISGKFNEHIWIGQNYNLFNLEMDLTELMDNVYDLECSSFDE